MRFVGSITVLPTVPPRLKRLKELASNLWWTWSPDAQALFAGFDPDLWRQTRNNPVQLLQEVDQARLDRAAADPDFVQAYDTVVAAFDAYLQPADTWLRRTYPELVGRPVAYFSAEFGLHESLPIYSGGLGILAGDHCKAASDLGLPLVGVGFFYRQGYFRQRIGPTGMQEALYERLEPETLPIELALRPDGKPATFTVELPGRVVMGRIWHVRVGRADLYLLDTDIPENRPEDRSTTARLYGGDAEVRLTQEILLGVGGVRALRTLGIEPAVWHLNEGHAAFLGLELIREVVQQGLSFDEAREVVAAQSMFTTHTPVPAGNDAFAFDLLERYFGHYWPQLDLGREEFFNLARQDTPWGPAFGMTVLALRLSGARNGVSALHGQVSRRLWNFLWPEIPAEEVPIGAITNGVHTQTWLGQEMAALYGEYLGADWADRLDDPGLWQGVDQIPDDRFWGARRAAKARLIAFVRARVQAERRRRGESPARVQAAQNLLDPNALTIGFARRFATYKRATLIFRDPERLKRLLNQPGRPIQFVFGGKAHPADEPGKALIQRICQLANEPGFEGKVVFLEDYDISLGRHLVQGCDLWLNTPLRPLEASGTSGEKAALNGVPNTSILDGWWREAYDGTNGWAIGDEREYESQEARDLADSQSLYDLLEHEIVPAFYERNDEGVPEGWLRYARAAIRTIAPVYNTRRMVREYVERYYLPTARRGLRFRERGYDRARQFVAWKASMAACWPSLQVTTDGSTPGATTVGKAVPVEATVYLDGLTPDDVRVEVVHARKRDGVIESLGVDELTCAKRHDKGALVYRGAFVPRASGTIVYGVRVVPRHPELGDKFELGLIRWA